MRTIKQPIKVIEDFFEAPELWRQYALKQEFSRDDTSTWPGVRTQVLNELSPASFSSIAEKLIKHTPGKRGFNFLKINFALVDGSYTKGWIHQDEPHFNVAGIIFLNPVSVPNSGISFFDRISNPNHTYNEQFVQENEASAEDRNQFLKFKEDQRSHFRQSTYVENIFNRCVMFHPDQWHSAEKYFGTTPADSRLTINFFGVAI